MTLYNTIESIGSRIYTFADNLIPPRGNRLLALMQRMSDAVRGIGQHFEGLTTVQLNTNHTLRALRFTNVFDLIRKPISAIRAVKATMTGYKIGSISETVIRGTQFCLSSIGSIQAALFVPFFAELFMHPVRLQQFYVILGVAAVVFGVTLSVLALIPDGWKVGKGLYLAHELFKAKSVEDKHAVFMAYLDIDLDAVIEKRNQVDLVDPEDIDWDLVSESDIAHIKEKLVKELGKLYNSDAFLQAVHAVCKEHQKKECELRVSLGIEGLALIKDIKSGQKEMDKAEAVEHLTYQLKRRLLRRFVQLLMTTLGLASSVILLISTGPVSTAIVTGFWIVSTLVNLYFASSGLRKVEKQEGSGMGLGTWALSFTVLAVVITTALVLTTTVAGYVGVGLLGLIWLLFMGYTLYHTIKRKPEPDAFDRIM